MEIESNTTKNIEEYTHELRLCFEKMRENASCRFKSQIMAKFDQI
jgi:hypothetical protein